MSKYHSIQTGYAPGGFHLAHPTRELDVAYSVFDNTDIRLILKTGTLTNLHRLTPNEAHETATRLLIATGAPQHIIDELLAIQETNGAAKENHW
jgi:hypothetical protein